MYIYRKSLVRVADVYFDEPQVSTGGADFIRYLARSSPVEGGLTARRATRLIRLSRPEPALFADLSKTARYEIRRAEERDQIDPHVFVPQPGPLDLERFADGYDRFAAGRGLRRGNRARLSSMRKAGRLALSRVETTDGISIWHAYYWNGARARLLHSACAAGEREDHETRARAARANRWLHWEDLRAFKNAGTATLDLGGWHTGSDPKLLRVNAFKQSLGGEIAVVYDTCVGASPLGRLALAALSLREYLNRPGAREVRAADAG